MKFDGTTIADLLNGNANDWRDRMLITDSQRVKDPIKWRKSSVMTNRWRLINGKELYDIKADPGQESNVASGHPSVVDRLTKFYDAWWKICCRHSKTTRPFILGILRTTRLA